MPWLIRPRRIFSLLIGLLALSVLLLFRGNQSETRIAPPWAVRGADSAALAGRAVPLSGQLQAVLPIPLQVQVAPGIYADADQAVIEAELRQALDYVSGRFGTSPRDAVIIQLLNNPACGLSGLAYTDIRTLQVNTCASIARPRAVAILAHEMVHQLAHDFYGDAHLHGDLLLNEGLATWGAGSYWLGSYADFRSFVREQYPAGTRYPLATHYAGLGVGAMNTLYYQWASFVDYLIQTYGRERFDALYVTGQGTPGSADYQGVYGKPLSELEQEWQRWLEQ